MIARGLLLLLMLGSRQRTRAFSVSRDDALALAPSTATLAELTFSSTTGQDSHMSGYLTSQVALNTTSSTVTSAGTVSPDTDTIGNETVTLASSIHYTPSGNNSVVVSSTTSDVPETSAVPVNKRYTTIYRNRTTDTTTVSDPITTSTSLDDVDMRHTTTAAAITAAATTTTTTTTTEQTTSTPNVSESALSEVTDKLQVSETRNDLLKYETTKKGTTTDVDTTTSGHVGIQNITRLVESTPSDTTTTQSVQMSSDKSSATRPSTTEGKKTSTLYTVKSTYKRPKKLEIVQPKPYLRDPNDNSWRNESISSLGIVFRPNDASNKTLALGLVKNRTDAEVSAPAPLAVAPPEPELKQRLDKLSSARRAGKRPSTPSALQHDYETDAPIFYDGEVEDVTPREDTGVVPGAGAELRAADFFREFQALLDAGTTSPPPVPPTTRSSTTQYFPPSSVKHFRELVEEVRPEPFVPTFDQSARGPLYAALVRRLPPCELRCGTGATGAVELSPDYELHYYIPEQEERAAPNPQAAHPALAIYPPRSLYRDGL